MKGKPVLDPQFYDFMFYNDGGFACDCSNIGEVKNFLQDYAYIIKDASSLFCKEDNGMFAWRYRFIG